MFKILDKCSFEYPNLLREIHDAPDQLYVKGVLPPPDTLMIAVVGSRNCTPYGRRTARMIVEGLAQAGVVIVSGLAYGIDAIAHEAALDVGGRTIGVLASGIDRVGPAGNTFIANRMLDRESAIITQFPPGTFPYRANFPVRNQVISGMCYGTLVIEAAEPSGTMITARAAIAQNREIFAVPGQIDSPTSTGPNLLIKDGAYVTTSASDILDILKKKGFVVGTSVVGGHKPDNEQEATLLSFLGKAPTHIDNIIEKSNLSTSTALATITMMEIKGKVRHVGGGHYIIG